MGYFISYKGRKIHFFDSGKGVPLVLVHGYLESAEIWSGLSEKLSGQFRVVAPDLPGHGLSDNCEEPCSMESLATIIKQLLSDLSLEKVFLIGHSLGGYVTLAFLELFPENLVGYCLFHSHPFADTPETIEKRNREMMIVSSGKKDLMYPENVKRMFADQNIDRFSEAVKRSKVIASKISAEGIISVLKGMKSRPSRLSLMEEGRIPSLWILGQMDNYIPADLIQEKVNLPLNSEVAVLKNSGHIGFVEEEQRSVEIISDFVGKITSSASAKSQSHTSG